MALRYGQCNCGRGLATERREMFGRDSMFCPKCVADYERELLPLDGLPMTAEDLAADAETGELDHADIGGYTREYHTQLLTIAVTHFAQAVQAWEARDREDPIGCYHRAAKVRLYANSIAAETAALAAFSYAAAVAAEPASRREVCARCGHAERLHTWIQDFDGDHRPVNEHYQQCSACVHDDLPHSAHEFTP